MKNIDFLDQYVDDNLRRRWVGRLDLSVWRPVESLLLREAAQSVGVGSSSAILDVGCGDGYFSNNVFDHERLVGIDIIGEDLKNARKYSIYKELIEADTSKKTSLAPDNFDFVFSNSVLEHIPALDGTLAEIHRVLRPGGRLFLTLPSHCFARRLFIPRLVRPVSSSWADRITVNVNRRYAHHNLLPPSTWAKKLGDLGFGNFSMVKYIDHREILAWDLFRYYLPNKVFRIAAKGFGVALTKKIFISGTKGIYQKYHMIPNGRVDDECTHNGLAILCQKLK